MDNASEIAPPKASERFRLGLSQDGAAEIRPLSETTSWLANKIRRIRSHWLSVQHVEHSQFFDRRGPESPHRYMDDFLFVFSGKAPPPGARR